MALTKASYSMITGAPVNILDFGAVGDGVTDDTVAIQAAIDYVVASATPNDLVFPEGTYKCSATIVVNVGFVSCIGQRAVLDFSTIGNIAAIQMIGGNFYFGEPYNQSDAVFSGFKIIGPSTSIASGITFDQNTVGGGPAHMIVRDCTITKFNNGLTFANNAYLITIEHCGIFECFRCVFKPSGTTNAGENIRVNNCTLFNSDEGFRNDNGSANFNFVGTSFDGLLTSVAITNGQANFTGCHFEYVAVANVAFNISANCIVTCSGCFFINTFSGQDKYINNAGFLSIYGGRIAVANNATNVVFSTARLNIIGCHIQSTTTTPVTVASGTAMVYLANVGTLSITNAIIADTIQGRIVGGLGQTVTCAVLNTYVNLGVGTSMGLYAFRDNSLGGTALFNTDTTIGATSIQNGITGLEMRFDTISGDMQIRVISGAAPRIIAFALFRVTV